MPHHIISHQLTYHNISSIAMRYIILLLTEEGMKGFYKGIIPTTAKAVVATAVTFAAYEVK